jgi:hypothetical protein
MRILPILKKTASPSMQIPVILWARCRIEPATTLSEPPLTPSPFSRLLPELPLRAGPAATQAMHQLLGRLRAAGLAEARLQGFAAPPSPATQDRAHLVAAALLMVLGMFWPLPAMILLLGLTLSALLGARTGYYLPLAPKKLAWNLMVQRNHRHVKRIVFVVLDRQRRIPTLRYATAVILALCCLTPSLPVLLPTAGSCLLLLFLGLYYVDRPFKADPAAPEQQAMAALLTAAQHPALKDTWLVASNAGVHGLQAVQDWWALGEKVELWQLDQGLPPLQPQARIVPLAALEKLLSEDGA